MAQQLFIPFCEVCDGCEQSPMAMNVFKGHQLLVAATAFIIGYCSPGYNLTDILLFGGFLGLAFAYRNRPELHKRWIIAATAALCGAALGRVVPGGTPQYLLLWLSPLLAMVAVDLLTQRRVHSIPVVSSALLVVAFFKVPLYSAPVWRAIGRALLQPFV